MTQELDGPGVLDGKVAIVTGGGGDIGFATARRFVQEGARVVLADVDAERGERAAAELGDAALYVATDVSDAEEVDRMVETTVERFGGLDILFNNAGIAGATRRFLADDLRDFDDVIGVNLRGVVLCTHRAARWMSEHGGGSIVNTASIAGINAGSGLMPYRAAKAGVIHFSRSVAVDVAEYGIRVNCVAPAHIATQINAFYDMPAIVKHMQPLQRQGTTEDVAETVLFLASDRAAQITGVVLPVDGGTTAGPPPSQVATLMKAGNESTEKASDG